MAEVNILQDAAVLIEHPRFGRGCLFGLKKGEDLAKAHYRAYLVTEKRFVRINKKDVPYWTSLRILRDDGRCDTISRSNVLRMINEDEPEGLGPNPEGDDDGAVAAPARPAQAPAPPAAPVYPRPRVRNNTHRYAEDDVLRFSREWRHKGLGAPRDLEAKITRAYTYRSEGRDYLVYDLLFSLANGKKKTITYTVKPLPRGTPGRDPDAAVDTSLYVSYLHS